jgi:hypothetical protein
MSPIRKHVVELDVLRWLAAVLMIVNHGGYRLLGAEDATTGLVGALVFIGSFAPVLFFFATGFGVALSVNATGRAPAFASTFVKAMLLVVADQLMFWRAGSPWGVNFLGFIGLSSLLVSVIARLRAAVPICMAAAAGLLVLRYGVGPRVFHAAGEGSWAAWLCGVRSLQDMAYPLAPWLVYPLVGFVLGRLYAPVRPDRSSPRDRWYGISLGAGVALLAGAGALFSAGAVFFRWGTVSAAYFVLSLGVLAVAGVLSMAMAASTPRVAARLSLQGVASFAVIPIHYGVLELVAAATGQPISAPAFLVVIALVGAICLWVSQRFATVVSAWVAGSDATAAAGALAGLLLVSVAVVTASATPLPPLAWAGMVAGQLGVAGLLAVRGRRAKG